MIRKHKLNSNLLVDLNIKQFVDYIKEKILLDFSKKFIDLFASDLKNDFSEEFKYIFEEEEIL